MTRQFLNGRVIKTGTPIRQTFGQNLSGIFNRLFLTQLNIIFYQYSGATQGRSSYRNAQRVRVEAFSRIAMPRFPSVECRHISIDVHELYLTASESLQRYNRSKL